ncbi:predicted protein [Naegleria gruberi]|uniref:Predicted protein n=1 Tax=Naegleria gruberi TaxID=5762 RepID=D2W655_NAEGR|nr:uncharacterized protein NAEGRDRAFT_76899 [Naegleria gruberi]EFC35446.1 predicted protein [Naegleria gruberi]|eukprot:XP_002668190.1 predicted protein [Naegleria gruberi strain NEG-M]
MPRFAKWTTIQDLADSFTNIKQFVHENLKYMSEGFTMVREKLEESHKHISKLITLYEFDPNELIGKLCDENELKVYSEVYDSDTEQQACMKMIILIYYYLSTAISCNWMNCEVREFCQFMDYAEERIIPQFFRCANHTYQEVRKGAEVEPFECGIDNLENWQKVVLHFIVKVHAEVLKCRKPISHVGFTEFPPCFLLLTVSNYFLERKNQLLKENPESYLSGANSWLLTDLFYYWNQFIEYITTPTEDDYELKAKNYYKNQAFVEGDPVEDNEIVCRIDRQPVVGDEIREMQADYKGIIHKIPFEPKPTREDIGKKLNVKMSPNQELYVLQTTEQEIRSQETVFAKIKRFVKQYGALGIVIYFGIYFLVLGTIFLLLQQGVFATKDVLQWLHSSGLDKLIDMSDLDKSEMYANAGVAWVLTKFTEPLRMAVTLAITPSIYRLLKKLMRK